MAATVEISESNGAGETVTDNISSGHYGTSDQANIAAATTEPITPGNNSYEKWQRLKWESGSAVQVDTIRIHKSTGSTPSNTDHFGSQDSGTPSNPTYTTPTDSASTEADTELPTSDPGVATISGTLSASGQYSGYWVHQVQVGASATDGDQTTVITWTWREIA